METIKKNISDHQLTFEQLRKETRVVDKEGNPVLMYSRSNSEFENFELGKRNLSTKEGANQIGFFFSNRDDLAHYGSFIKSRYLNIKKPWDIRELGIRTEYKNFRQKLKDIGISDKDLAGYDLQFQKLNIKRNKKLGSNHGLYKDGDALLPMHETRMATFNFFDAGEGYYLRKLLQAKGFDGILFEDEGELTAIVFEPKQIVDPFSN